MGNTKKTERLAKIFLIIASVLLSAWAIFSLISLINNAMLMANKTTIEATITSYTENNEHYDCVLEFDYNGYTTLDNFYLTAEPTIGDKITLYGTHGFNTIISTSQINVSLTPYILMLTFSIVIEAAIILLFYLRKKENMLNDGQED